MSGDEKKTPAADNQATIFVAGTGVQLPSSHPEPDSAPKASGNRHVQVGDVLNHMFEVRRFIARGGMGEVFEGVNVASDERVAIKVMLPSMSADEKLLALFRKEARTLTRLNHPALVQYRVLAQEPQLGAFYIVTEFVDGKNLSEVISQVDPTPGALIDLMGRLASGLEAAHALGAIHRDMSPDNVMLENGMLSNARIIDFGIAKDLNAGPATIIGDGFAGKLNYVAPEQLGDFDRSIGPWTDVYSLGLIILAVAANRDVDMGGTLVNAVDKRRSGPDLSHAPEELRPLLSRMLRPNPEERIRSMGEVLSLLRDIKAGRTVDGPAGLPDAEPAGADPAAPDALATRRNEDMPVAGTLAATPVAWAAPETPAIEQPTDQIATSATPLAPPEDRPAKADELSSATATSSTGTAIPKPPPPAAKPDKPGTAGKSRTPMIIGGIAVVALLAAGGIWFSMNSGKAGDAILQSDSANLPGSASGDATAVQAALIAGLPSVGCSWLDVVEVSGGAGGVTAKLRGVAGKPDEARNQIAQMLAAKNLKVGSFDFADVATINAAECTPVETLSQIRDPAIDRMTVQQRQIEMTRQTSGAYAGSVAAKAVTEFNLGDPNQEIALFGIEPSGKISKLLTERAQLTAASETIGENRYRLSIDLNHAGWSGLILLSGKPPFEGHDLAGPPGSHTGDWSQRFLGAAKEGGWKADMVWFNTVDAVPD